MTNVVDKEIFDALKADRDRLEAENSWLRSVANRQDAAYANARRQAMDKMQRLARDRQVFGR